MADQEHPKAGPSLEEALEAAKRNGGVVVITNAGKIAGMLCIFELPEAMRMYMSANPDTAHQIDETVRQMGEEHTSAVPGVGFIDVDGDVTPSGSDTTRA